MTWTQSAMPETLFDKYLLAVAQGELAAGQEFYPATNYDNFARHCVNLALALFAARERARVEQEAHDETHN